jgi:hypothetical protein
MPETTLGPDHPRQPNIILAILLLDLILRIAIQALAEAIPWMQQKGEIRRGAT